MHRTVVQKGVKMVFGDLPAHRIAQYHAFGKRVNKRMEDVFMDAYREDMETCAMNIVIQNAMKRFAFKTELVREVVFKTGRVTHVTVGVLK